MPFQFKASLALSTPALVPFFCALANSVGGVVYIILYPNPTAGGVGGGDLVQGVGEVVVAVSDAQDGDGVLVANDGVRAALPIDSEISVS